MKKSLSVLMVLVLMMVTMVSFVSAEELTEDFDFRHFGEGLKELGILKGTDKGLELDSELTRIQGMIIYFRMLGYEGKDLEELNIDTKHPFTDVPKWADTEVGVLYNLGLVKGISKTKLGSNAKMTIEQFTTLMLRALGYNDSEGDFIWDKSVEKLLEELMMLEEYDPEIYKYFKNRDKFTRGDMSYIALQTLYFNVKDSDEMLIDKLGIEDTLISESIVKISDEDAEKIPEKFREIVYYIIEHDYSEEYQTEDITMYDVNFTKGEGEDFNLEFSLKIVHDGNDGLKEYTKSIYAEFKVEDGNINCYNTTEETIVKISDEDVEKIPEKFRRDVYYIIEDGYSGEYQTEDLTIYDVEFTQGEGEDFTLKFNLKIVCDDNGELKEVIKDIILEYIIEDGNIKDVNIID